MSRSGLGLLIVIVLATNALILVGVARNRSGEPDTQIELTERELRLPYDWEDGIGKDDSGLALHLRWNVRGADADQIGASEWFDVKRLEELGFDCSEPVTAPEAGLRYGKILSRETYAVLEQDGDSWSEWQARKERQTEALARKVERGEGTEKMLESEKAGFERSRRTMSRLFVVDVGNDPVALRTRYPDRGRFIVAPAQVRLLLLPSAHDPGNAVAPGRPAALRGSIVEILVSEMHVPRDLRSFLDEVLAARKAEREEHRFDPAYSLGEDREPRYAVTLRYGSRYEPWVVDVRPLEENR